MENSQFDEMYREIGFNYEYYSLKYWGNPKAKYSESEIEEYKQIIEEREKHFELMYA